MSEKTPFLLTDLVVEENSLVNRGANPGAKIILLKSECDKMESKETKERIGLLKTLAKYLNIGKQEGDKLIIDTEGDTLSNEALEKLQKQFNAQGAAILQLTIKNAFGDLMAAAVDAIAKADDATAVDLVLTKAKSDIDALKTESKIDDAEFFKGLHGTADEDLKRRAEERKAKLEAKTSKADLTKFRDVLPEALHKAFDGMSADDQGKFMTSYGKTDEENPMAKALETVTGENATLKKRLDKIEGESELAKAMIEFKDLENFVKMDEFVPSIITLRKLNEDAANTLVTQTRAMAAQSKAAGIFKVVGANGDLETGAEGKLAKAVAAHIAANPSDNEAVATTKVLAAKPSLYGDVEEERIAG